MISIPLKCMWDVFQDRPYVRPQIKSQKILKSVRVSFWPKQDELKINNIKLKIYKIVEIKQSMDQWNYKGN